MKIRERGRERTVIMEFRRDFTERMERSEEEGRVAIEQRMLRGGGGWYREWLST